MIDFAETYPVHTEVADMLGGVVFQPDPKRAPFIALDDDCIWLCILPEAENTGYVLSDTGRESAPFHVSWKRDDITVRRVIKAAREVLP